MLNRRLFYIIPPIATTYQPFLLQLLETLSGRGSLYRTPAPKNRVEIRFNPVLLILSGCSESHKRLKYCVCIPARILRRVIQCIQSFLFCAQTASGLQPILLCWSFQIQLTLHIINSIFITTTYSRYAQKIISPLDEPVTGLQRQYLYPNEFVFVTTYNTFSFFDKANDKLRLLY